MKTLTLFLCLVIGAVFKAPSQTLILLSKGETFKPPLDNMIVMDKYTFGSYQYTSDKYDTLKLEVQQLDSILRQRDSSQLKLTGDYERALQIKDQEINTYKEGFTSLKTELNTSVEKNNQLLVDYKKLENKHNRAKHWRNIFLGTALLSTSILVLIVAH